MASKLLIAAALGLAAGAGAAFLALRVPEAPQPATAGRVAIGGPFSLIDQRGQRRTEKDYSGKPMLVFFGFTNCPDVCPSG
ncbi:MAG: SCO family protein, partial [Deltaproteobacteria bacterium]